MEKMRNFRLSRAGWGKGEGEMGKHFACKHCPNLQTQRGEGEGWGEGVGEGWGRRGGGEEWLRMA